MRAASLSGLSLPLLAIFSLPTFAQQFNAESLAPYIPSPQVIVDRMLELARVRPGETVYDLGSGDGRVLFTAARKYQAKAVGVELSPELCRSTTEKIERMGLQNQVTVLHANLLK